MFKEVLIPLLLFVLFFVIESRKKLSENQFTFLVLFATAIVWFFQYNSGELYLYLAGLILGMIIEIGMRVLGYQQVWRKAHLFGVPYWLPLIWALGFVVITRLGIFLRGI